MRKSWVVICCLLLCVVVLDAKAEKPSQQRVITKRVTALKGAAAKSGPMTTLRLDRRFLSVRGNEVLFRPGSRARRSRYKVYHFPKQNFFKFFKTLRHAHGKVITYPIHKRRATHATIPVGRITTVHYHGKVQMVHGPVRRRLPVKPVRKSRYSPLYLLPKHKFFLLRHQVVGSYGLLPIPKRRSASTFNGVSVVSVPLIPTTTRSSVYIKLLLPAKQFDAFRRKYPKAKKFVVQFQKVNKRSSRPRSDRPSPMGGFLYVSIMSRIVEAR